VEFLRQNYRKALKVLGSAPKSPIVTDAGECLSAFYFNNIACVHYQLGKYSLAAHYFTKAIEENDAALNGFPPLDRGEKKLGVSPSPSPHSSHNAHTQQLPSQAGPWQCWG